MKIRQGTKYPISVESLLRVWGGNAAFSGRLATNWLYSLPVSEY